MKKLNGLVLVLAGIVGCSAYASEKSKASRKLYEPMSPRTINLSNCEFTLDHYSLEPKHIKRLLDIKSKIDGKFKAIASTEQRKIDESLSVMRLIEAAQKGQVCKVEEAQAQQLAVQKSGE
ncbi:MAG: hypothetical protein ACHQVS_01325 [Candidatus Babeliales bacterium]